MELKTTGNECDTCAAPLISHRRMRSLTPDQLAEVRARGWKRAHYSERCNTCSKRRDHGLAGRTTAKMSREDFLAEWEHMHDPHATILENCKRLAPRLGYARFDAMERRLQRAGVVSPFNGGGYTRKAAA